MPPRPFASGGGARVERPPSLSEHVCQVLRDDILSGRLAPGERLIESAIIDRTGVSRTPVREGLRRLEAEGLVVSHRGRGTYITYRLSPEEAQLIYECRLTLEPYLTRLATERMGEHELDEVQVVLDRFVAAVGAADAREAGQLDSDFHLTIYEASGSELMSVLRGYWSRFQLELSERVYTAELPRDFVDEHIGIHAAMAAGDADLAAERMHRHIEHGRKALELALGAAAPA